NGVALLVVVPGLNKCEVTIVANSIVSGDTKSTADFQVVDDIVSTPERFVRNIPSDRSTGEDPIAIALTKAIASIRTKHSAEQVLLTECIGNPSKEGSKFVNVVVEVTISRVSTRRVNRRFTEEAERCVAIIVRRQVLQREAVSSA